MSARGRYAGHRADQLRPRPKGVGSATAVYRAGTLALLGSWREGPQRRQRQHLALARARAGRGAPGRLGVGADESAAAHAPARPTTITFDILGKLRDRG